MAENMDKPRRTDASGKTNPDAITGAPGSHPVGTGIGAASAGAAGAAIGSVVPGVGTAIGGAAGAVIGAVAGGLLGKGVAEGINPTDEDAYWRENYSQRPYVTAGSKYDDYAPAYRYGYTMAASNPDEEYEDFEQQLQRDWASNRQKSSLDWNKARPATRDAWERIRESMREA
jgi:hypothetical protein